LSVTSGSGPDATRFLRREATDKAESRGWYSAVLASTYLLPARFAVRDAPPCHRRVAVV